MALSHPNLFREGELRLREVAAVLSVWSGVVERGCMVTSEVPGSTPTHDSRPNAASAGAGLSWPGRSLRNIWAQETPTEREGAWPHHLAALPPSAPTPGVSRVPPAAPWLGIHSDAAGTGSSCAPASLWPFRALAPHGACPPCGGTTGGGGLQTLSPVWRVEAAAPTSRSWWMTGSVCDSLCPAHLPGPSRSLGGRPEDQPVLQLHGGQGHGTERLPAPSLWAAGSA